ncbi:MAG: hypothetical protein H6Q89_3008 [Myxococcaceae bacterium]|nr:hypothetical protein [Myxococcaceae bacterium]
MKNALAAVFVLGILGAIGWSVFKPKYPTPMEFTDVYGDKHSFPGYQTQRVPVLVTCFSERDSFSPRSLELFQKLRDQYPAERLAIFAFHMEAADPVPVKAYAETKQYGFSLVAMKASPALGLDLYQTLGVSMAGDVAVIDKRGRIIKVIETKGLTAAEFDAQVMTAVKKVAGN